MHVTVERAKAIADMVRGTNPDMAAEIDKRIAELADGDFESLGIEVDIHFKLEKFHGEWEPGKEPFEVIEGTG